MTKTIFGEIMTAVLTIVLPAVAIAQECADTITVHTLDEIIVQAPKVIHKADMDVLYPSRSAVENSKNGMQLLNNLMIPTLTVNDVMVEKPEQTGTVRRRKLGHF